ncbi:MAG: hypothetical protein HQK76_17610 [Desulfobacterales bacterium]|nr:hypothetical protein [Desulfobacterales bacterium]
MKIKSSLMFIFFVLFTLIAGCSYNDDCCPPKDDDNNKPNRVVTISTIEDSDDVLSLNGKISEPSGSEIFQWTSDNIDGDLGFGFDFKIDKTQLSEGTHKITLSVYENGTLLASASVSISVKHPEPIPVREVKIVSPLDGTNITYDITSIKFKGSVTNALGTEVFKWMSNINGELGYGEELEINSADIAENVHTITLLVYDNNVLIGSTSISIVVNHVPSTRQVEIISPTNGESISYKESIVNFKGKIDITIGDETFKWNSNIDGEIGTGIDLQISSSKLSAGNHQITLLVYQGTTLLGSASICIVKEAEPVNRAPQTYIKTGPPTYFSGNHFVIFTWEGIDPDNDPITYKYKLDGPVSTGWVYTSETQNSKICVNDSGLYTFSVVAIDSKGLEDSTADVYQFEAHSCSS